jgi:hypothetical protein
MRQRHAPVVALEQHGTDLLLQSADTAAERRRADVTGIAGAAEMETVGQVLKVLQGTDVHPQSIA